MFGKNMVKGFIIIAVLLLFPFTVYGLQQDNVRVSLTRTDSLRSLAAKYFDDPNLWQIIMYYNGFQKVSEIQPGTVLTIPVKLFKQGMGRIQDAQDIIYKANMEGANVLAPDMIEQAIKIHKNAISLLNNGKLETAGQTALQAFSFAKQALEETKRKRIQSVSAILTRKKNIVQSRKPEQNVWNETIVNQELIEKERVRTLSESSGEILFIDGSRLNLNENSLTVIGTMEQDRITKSRKTSVTLLQGDVLVYLSSLNQKNDFDMSTPEVGSVIRSKEFRTSRDTKEITRFANYDGEIDVKAQGARVTIQKNEGTKIEPGRKPEPPVKLLPPPAVINPLENQTLFSPEIRFEWEKVKGAKLYKLKISDDPEFAKIIHTGESTDTQYTWKASERGKYYFKIYSRDNNNLAGPFSKPLSFFADIDVSPPFLVVLYPAKDETVFFNILVIKGIVEKNADVTINRKIIKPSEDGNFTFKYILNNGIQDINVKAVDPAGNITLITRKVNYSSQDHLIFLDVPNPMIVNHTPVTIKGRIQAGTKVRINEKPVKLSNNFSHILYLSEGQHEIRINGTNHAGKIQDIVLDIIVDLTSPDIYQDELPGYTAGKSINLSGRFSEDVLLRINDLPVLVKEKQYNYPAELKQGNNFFALVAEDTAGNRTQKILSIIQDMQGPEIVNYKVLPASVKGGEIVTLTVEAKDKGVGLARTGSFILDISGTQFSGILTLKQGSDLTQGSVFIPPGITGKVKVNKIQLRDHLGNEIILP